MTINRAQLNLMVTGFMRNHAITVVPEGVKAYPWANEQDWKDAISRHHVALEIAGLVLKEEEEAILGENLVTGNEHSAVYAYYLTDDEDTSDVSDLDKASYHADVSHMKDMNLIGAKSADALLAMNHNDPEW